MGTVLETHYQRHKDWLPPSLPASRAPSHRGVMLEGFSDFITSFILCALLVAGILLLYPQCRHWFVFPILISGSIMGRDAVAWLRGRMEVFDPAGLLGILGIHLFISAPLLHVGWDYWFTDKSDVLIAPDDWRIWIGSLALIYIPSLLIYQLSRWYFGHKFERKPFISSYWRLRPKRFFPLAGALIVIGSFIQVWIFIQQGALSALMERAGSGGPESNPLNNTGVLLMLSDRVPAILAIAALVHMGSLQSKAPLRTLPFVFPFWVIFLFIWIGLRGSRSASIIEIVWMIGIWNFMVRPVSRWKMILAGLLIFTFLYNYVFYKAAGREWQEYQKEQEGLKAWGEETDRQLERVILHDMARVDIQAYIVFRLTEYSEEFDYGYGRGYLGTATLAIPKWIWPGRPQTVSREGVDILFGRGAYLTRRTYKVHGLLGEALLNFGVFIAPLSFIALGWLVAFVRAIRQQLLPGDCRYFLLPVLILTCVSAISSESPNIFFLLAMRMFWISLLLYVSSEKLKVVRTPARDPLP